MALQTREPGPSQGAEGIAAGVIPAKLVPDRLPATGPQPGPGRRVGFEPPGGGRGLLDPTSALVM